MRRQVHEVERGSGAKTDFGGEASKFRPLSQKSVLPYAMAVMDNIEGWEEEEQWVSSRFAACMWIYTKAVIYNGQGNMQEYLVQGFRSVMEGVN